MKTKRLAVVAIVVILVAAIAALMLMPKADDRTRTEKLILTASDLAGMNATQHSEPFPSPYHPAARNGSEAAESHFSMTVDGWFLDVDCLLVLYNSSSLANQTFEGLKKDANFTEAGVGDGCLMWSHSYNETFGTDRVIRSISTATLLKGQTITTFVFTAYPPDGAGTVSPQVIAAILEAQADKVQRMT